MPTTINTTKSSKKPTDELVIRIKNKKLRKHLEDEARRTGRTPEALVNEVFDDLQTSRRTVELYTLWTADQRRQHENALKELEKQWKEGFEKEVLPTVEAELRKVLREQLEPFVNAAHSWRDSAQKAVDLCWKFAVKVGYFQTVRRQRDELLALVERVVASKKVDPDEVGMVYAIAEKERIDRMIDRIQITRPPDIAPFDPSPPPPATTKEGA
jgi:DNA-binding transcriptional regulator YbjK